MNTQTLKGEICTHKNTRGVDWFDGGYVEICKGCGMSRYMTEQETMAWEYKDFAKELSEQTGFIFEASLKQVKYKEYGFCKDQDCYAFSEGCHNKSPFNCPHTAKEFMEYLKENKYKIIKEKSS